MTGIYTTYVCDEGHFYGVDSVEKLRAILGLHLLFNDYLVATSSALLGNRFLYSLWQNEPKSLGRIFRKGFVKPIILKGDTRPASVSEVAESIIKSRTIVRSRKPQILDLAKRIDESVDVSQLPIVEESLFRERFRDRFTSIIRDINEKGLQGTVFDRPNKCNRLLRELDSMGSSPLSCTWVYRVANKSLTPAIRRDIKVCSLITYEETLSDMLRTEIAVTPVAMPFSAKLNELVPRAATAADYPRTRENVKLTAPFPFDALLTLPLENILEMRKIPSVRRLRKVITKNATKPVSENSITDALLNVVHDISDVIEQHPASYARAIKRKRREPSVKRLRWYSSVGLAVGGPIIALIAGEGYRYELILLGMSPLLFGAIIPGLVEHMHDHREVPRPEKNSFEVVIHPAGQTTFGNLLQKTYS